MDQRTTISGEEPKDTRTQSARREVELQKRNPNNNKPLTPHTARKSTFPPIQSEQSPTVNPFNLPLKLRTEKGLKEIKTNKIKQEKTIVPWFLY